MTPIFLTHPKARCDLAVPGVSHLPLLLNIQNDPDIRQYLMRRMPLGEKDERDWLEKANSGPSDAVFIITLKDKKRTPVGSMGLHRIDLVNRRATTGSAMLLEHCGKGYGTDAKMLLLNWAFNELGLRKIESRVIAFNGRSQAYSEKCGYKVVGRLKEHTLRHGTYHNEIIMEVWADEWRKLWKKFEAGTFRK